MEAGNVNILDESGMTAAIKDLFLHLHPMIHIAGSSENTLEMLLFLADMDPNFHKLELVKGIRKALRETFSSKIEGLVNSYLQEHEGKIKEENVVDYLADEVFHDKLFLDFKSEFENVIKKAVSEMRGVAHSSSFKDIFTEIDNDEYLVNKVSPVSSNETSLNSSLNQSGFLFLSPAQYNNIAESLRKKYLYENLHNSLDLLLTVTPGEPVSQPLWPSIRKSLKEFLQCDDVDLFGKSLQFHTRLLSSQVHNAVKEGFLSLIESLSGFWLSKKLIQKVPFQNSPIIIEENRILIIMKVIVQFLKEFPSIWIRYPIQYVAEMIDLFFSLFTIHVTQKGKERVSILDMLCLLDPKASWFYAWTHGQLGRKKTVDALKTKPSLLSASFSFCQGYLEGNCDFLSEEFNGSLNADRLKFLKFNHSLNILFCIIRYSDGRELFPIYDIIRKDHFSLKKVLHMFVNVLKPLKQTLVSKVILKMFSHFSDSKENLCKLLCEIGIVDSFIEIIVFEEPLAKSVKLKSWYFTTVLEFFISINSTSIGHEYLLTGKLSKMSSKTPLIVATQTPANKIFAFTKNLITYNHSISTKVIKTSITLCCHLLQSPFGKHIFLSHSLIIHLMTYLQGDFNVIDKKYPALQFCEIDLKTSFEEHFEYVIEKLLLSHCGLLLMEKSHILSHILNLILPDLALKGEVSCKLLNSIVSSQQGCSLLGKNFIVKPFWDMLGHIIDTESLLRPPLHYEELNEALEEALIPLLCISSTFEGVKLLYSKAGLMDEMGAYLLDPHQQETELYSLALKLLGLSTSNLDGVLFLEGLFSLQETMVKQQRERMTSAGVIIDENSIMRSHILTASFIPRGNKKFSTHPFIIEDELPSKLNMVYTLPLYTKDKGDKSVKAPPLKKQSELWRFLNDTRAGLHDSTWLIHARRVYRVELSANEEIKMALLMELVELSLDVLSNSSDEVLQDASHAQCDIREELPSPISISFSNTIFCFPSSSEPGTPCEEIAPNYDPKINKATKEADSPIPKDGICISSSLGTEMMIRYGSELNLIPDNIAQRSNLLKLKISTDEYLLNNKSHRFDWFSILIYYLTGGSVERTFTLLRKLRSLKIGAMIWPSLMGGLWISYEMAPSEFLFSSIIHCIKLVLFRDAPTAFLAFENIGGGVIWNLVSEWINHSFVGVLPWPENLHMVLVPILHGVDYLVYSLVCLLLHLHKTLVGRTSQTEFKKIVYLQTETIDTWKIQEHFSAMDSLSKRFRRTVLDALTQPLSHLRYDYAIKQI